MHAYVEEMSQLFGAFTGVFVIALAIATVILPFVIISIAGTAKRIENKLARLVELDEAADRRRYDADTKGAERRHAEAGRPPETEIGSIRLPVAEYERW